MANELFYDTIKFNQKMSWIYDIENTNLCKYKLDIIIKLHYYYLCTDYDNTSNRCFRHCRGNVYTSSVELCQTMIPEFAPIPRPVFRHTGITTELHSVCVYVYVLVYCVCGIYSYLLRHLTFLSIAAKHRTY